ncbi:hypothetical protein E1293_45300 [Actinomadura darangshiensis]|uniref:Uncharacterized protein n=1 Tax=Actinomadura darangshiensis TaxID=705336 RepID=A0A4R4ZSS6_9ACTN|nr:hypothetical protein [Actinomadura darangshiensis]TDD61019.1 hypothetical protein E1293_45300 [Actinomadura darangshiensis]
MGHDSVRAAMIYQHAKSEAGRAIADALNDKIKAERGGDDEDDGGLGGALVPVGQSHADRTNAPVQGLDGGVFAGGA